jgi:hypothetical protein
MNGIIYTKSKVIPVLKHYAVWTCGKVRVKVQIRFKALKHGGNYMCHMI